MSRAGRMRRAGVQLRNMEACSPQNDPQRPLIHFAPPRGWMNDPNGLIHINGEYHMFYQYNPRGAAGPPRARIAWGHARSRDLARWEHLPPALLPDRNYDRGGAWSGCAVRDETGAAAILYTGAGCGPFLPQSQCLATSRDMIHWRKSRLNPVIKYPPPGVPRWCFRDPFVWKHAPGRWLMAVGASLWGRGAVLLYDSANLRRWSGLGPLFAAENPARQGWMWECPNVVRFGDRRLIVVSVPGGQVLWFSGGMSEALKFEPERSGVLDPGGCAFAPQVFTDAAGRRILFAWLRENRANAARRGWQGCMSLPRVISLDDSGRPVFTPAPELETLRGAPVRLENLDVAPGAALPLPGVRGGCLEIRVRLHSGGARRLGLLLLDDNNSRRRTAILYDTQKAILSVDRSHSSADSGADRSMRSAHLPLGPGELLDMRLFLDRSVIEIFANGRVCMACRIYPEQPDRLHAALIAQGGAARAESVDAWRLCV